MFTKTTHAMTLFVAAIVLCGTLQLSGGKEPSLEPLFIQSAHANVSPEGKASSSNQQTYFDKALSILIKAGLFAIILHIPRVFLLFLKRLRGKNEIIITDSGSEPNTAGPQSKNRYVYWVTAIALGIIFIFGSGLLDKEDRDYSAENSELTSEEIEKISKSIIFLTCSADNIEGSDKLVFGSGTLFPKSLINQTNQEGQKVTDYRDVYILTNGHVAPVKPLSTRGLDFNLCVAMYDTDTVVGTYGYDESASKLNNAFDVALLKYAEDIHGTKQEIPSLDIAGNSLKGYSPCSVDELIGKNVYIFGYPSSTFDIQEHAFMKVQDEHLIVSKGLISGIDRNGNYYTDGKVDAGNSGGLAVSKINGEVCIVGIPTWLSQGSYENLGVIQPFRKVIESFSVSSER